MNLLGVKLLSDDGKEEVNLEVVLNGAFDKFLTLRAKRRKEILEVMAAATKEVKNNGTTAKH